MMIIVFYANVFKVTFDELLHIHIKMGLGDIVKLYILWWRWYNTCSQGYSRSYYKRSCVYLYVINHLYIYSSLCLLFIYSYVVLESNDNGSVLQGYFIYVHLYASSSYIFALYWNPMIMVVYCKVIPMIMVVYCKVIQGHFAWELHL